MGLDDPLPPRGDVGHYAHEWTWEEQKIASTPQAAALAGREILRGRRLARDGSAHGGQFRPAVMDR
jgi:hypothetical protein